MLERISVLAHNTFRESIRSKILYSIMCFALLIVSISAVFGAVTIGDQIKVIKDFGLFSISIFSVAFAVISGSALLSKELSRKTVYNILAKPVRRSEFIIGKFLGLFVTAATMAALMGVGLFILISFMVGGFEFSVFTAVFYILLELMIVCAAAIFFSSIVVTPMLSGLFTFGIFIAGRAITYLLYFVEQGDITGALAQLLTVLHYILPNLNDLNVSDQIVYNIGVSLEHTIWSIIYSIGYSAVLLAIGSLIFKRREFN